MAVTRETVCGAWGRDPRLPRPLQGSVLEAEPPSTPPMRLHGSTADTWPGCEDQAPRGSYR